MEWSTNVRHYPCGGRASATSPHNASGKQPTVLWIRAAPCASSTMPIATRLSFAAGQRQNPRDGGWFAPCHHWHWLHGLPLPPSPDHDAWVLPHSLRSRPPQGLFCLCLPVSSVAPLVAVLRCNRRICLCVRVGVGSGCAFLPLMCSLSSLCNSSSFGKVAEYAKCTRWYCNLAMQSL
jgi:hypothetical protein